MTREEVRKRQRAEEEGQPRADQQSWCSETAGDSSILSWEEVRKRQKARSDERAARTGGPSPADESSFWSNTSAGSSAAPLYPPDSRRLADETEQLVHGDHFYTRTPGPGPAAQQVQFRQEAESYSNSLDADLAASAKREANVLPPRTGEPFEGSGSPVLGRGATGPGANTTTANLPWNSRCDTAVSSLSESKTDGRENPVVDKVGSSEHAGVAPANADLILVRGQQVLVHPKTSLVGGGGEQAGNSSHAMGAAANGSSSHGVGGLAAPHHAPLPAGMNPQTVPRGGLQDFLDPRPPTSFAKDLLDLDLTAEERAWMGLEQDNIMKKSPEQFGEESPKEDAKNPTESSSPISTSSEEERTRRRVANAKKFLSLQEARRERRRLRSASGGPGEEGVEDISFVSARGHAEGAEDGLSDSSLSSVYSSDSFSDFSSDSEEVGSPLEVEELHEENTATSDKKSSGDAFENRLSQQEWLAKHEAKAKKEHAKAEEYNAQVLAKERKQQLKRDEELARKLQLEEATISPKVVPTTRDKELPGASPDGGSDDPSSQQPPIYNFQLNNDSPSPDKKFEEKFEQQERLKQEQDQEREFEEEERQAALSLTRERAREAAVKRQQEQDLLKEKLAAEQARLEEENADERQKEDLKWEKEGERLEQLNNMSEQEFCDATGLPILSLEQFEISVQTGPVFVQGRSGTGKTTVLERRALNHDIGWSLFQKWAADKKFRLAQQAGATDFEGIMEELVSVAAFSQLDRGNTAFGMSLPDYFSPDDQNPPLALFVTASPTLAEAIRQHYARLRRSVYTLTSEESDVVLVGEATTTDSGPRSGEQGGRVLAAARPEVTFANLGAGPQTMV